jgi:hypothetical protein
MKVWTSKFKNKNTENKKNVLKMFSAKKINGLRSIKMPTYPSSLYKGVSPSSLGSNVTGSVTISNLTNYQELNDIVNGSGVSLDFNSAANYPTDSNIGTEIIANRTRTITDFASIVSSLTTVLGNYTTAINSCSDDEKKIAASFVGLSYNNLQSKMEKITFELNRMNADLTSLGAEGATDSLKETANRHYPSSFNRFTNTAGGI